MTDAFHLPALQDLPTTVRTFERGSAVSLRFADVTPALLNRQIAQIVAARKEYLADRPISKIVEVIDRVAARFQDPSDPIRLEAEANLPAITGYSLPMIRTVLDRMASDWRAPALERLLRCEFGDPSILDGFATSGGRTSYAAGPDLVTHIFSGNVPGVAVTSMIRALLVKSGSIGKSARGEPLLAALFARGVFEADPDLGRCMAVVYWPGGDEELEKVALARAGAVIVYGGSDAVDSFRRRTPANAAFIGYGHKISFAMIGRQALAGSRAPDCARLVARDTAMFDQQGCVSPHIVYVEAGGEVTPRRWAELLAGAMADVERELPRGVLDPGEASAIRQLRGAVEFRQLSGADDVLHESDGSTAWTVVYQSDPTFESSCLNRVIRVKEVDDLDSVSALLEPLEGVLQTVGLEVGDGRRADLGKALAKLGVSRICSLGEMAWPPPEWHHDGRPPLSDLVRWCDLEP